MAAKEQNGLNAKAAKDAKESILKKQEREDNAKSGVGCTVGMQSATKNSRGRR